MYTHPKTKTDVAQNPIDDPLSNPDRHRSPPQEQFYVKKYGGTGSISEKWKLCMQDLTKEWKRKQPIYFYNIFILYLQPRIIRTSGQGAQFMNFLSQILFNDINHGYRTAIMKKHSSWLPPLYMAVATHFYYQMVRTMRTGIVSYLVKGQQWKQPCIVTIKEKASTRSKVCMAGMVASMM